MPLSTAERMSFWKSVRSPRVGPASPVIWVSLLYGWSSCRRLLRTARRCSPGAGRALERGTCSLNLAPATVVQHLLGELPRIDEPFDVDAGGDTRAFEHHDHVLGGDVARFSRMVLLHRRGLPTHPAQARI